MGLNGEQIITQACTQCHNAVLDQAVSREKFNVDLSNMADTLGGVLTCVVRDAKIEAATRYLCSQMEVHTSVCANVMAYLHPLPAAAVAAPGYPGLDHHQEYGLI